MPFDFASAKAQVRRTVHDTLAVQAFYKVNATSSAYPLRIRWHNRLVQQGSVEGEGAVVIEGVDRIVFFREQLQQLNLTLSRGGILTVPVYNITLQLDTRWPTDGPLEEVWEVTRV